MNSFSFISSIAQQQSHVPGQTDRVRGHTGQVLPVPAEGHGTEEPSAWQVSVLIAQTLILCLCKLCLILRMAGWKNTLSGMVW